MSSPAQNTATSPVLGIVQTEDAQLLVQQLSAALGFPQANIVRGTPAHGSAFLQSTDAKIRYIVIDIGSRTSDILTEIDQLAESCPADVRVVAIGDTNDINLYRALIQRGVLEYFPKPVDIKQLHAVITAAPKQNSTTDTTRDSRVITFMSAASGDGASIVALNTAYCLAKFYHKSVVVVDMDFQFGMIARNLDLSTPFGIKELFEHSERTIDATLINRMLVDYGDTLKVMAAPSDLRLWPEISIETIKQLLDTLREHFDYVIIDLPHIWSNWTATALSEADQNVLVAQLWLRSVTHTSRLLNAWRDIGVPEEHIITLINRSGAKFKEAVTPRDYENVCRKTIDYYIGNDIKAIVAAENEGKTIPEVTNAPIVKQFKEFAAALAGETITAQLNETSTKSSLSLGSLFNK